jgi:hypothetical protein
MLIILHKKYFYECPDWKAVSLAEIFHIVSVNVDESSFASPPHSLYTGIYCIILSIF